MLNLHVKPTFVNGEKIQYHVKTFIIPAFTKHQTVSRSNCRSHHQSTVDMYVVPHEMEDLTTCSFIPNTEDLSVAEDELWTSPGILPFQYSLNLKHSLSVTQTFCKHVSLSTRSMFKHELTFIHFLVAHLLSVVVVVACCRCIMVVTSTTSHNQHLSTCFRLHALALNLVVTSIWNTGT